MYAKKKKECINEFDSGKLHSIIEILFIMHVFIYFKCNTKSEANRKLNMAKMDHLKICKFHKHK